MDGRGDLLKRPRRGSEPAPISLSLTADENVPEDRRHWFPNSLVSESDLANLRFGMTDVPFPEAPGNYEERLSE